MIDMQETMLELDAARTACARAADWLGSHVGSDGEPADAAERNGWSRLGWGLAVAGRPDAAAAVVSWIARNRIAADGGFQPGRLRGQDYIAVYPHYWLGTFVVSAWLAGRLDVAMRSMAYLRTRQDTQTGGIPMVSEADGEPVCDMLSTAQVGLGALVTGDRETAEKCALWVRALAEQSAGESLVFHSCRKGADLWIDPDPAFVWSAVADFSRPRQAYYTPGMGAVFLARFAARYGCAQSIAAARRLLAFNLNGSSAQFDDLASVQACKFGWAVAEMALADPEGDWHPWVQRMTRWFLDRQSQEGAWGPSAFAMAAPSLADRLVKTSEHLMELSVCMAALGAVGAGR
ncbi:hypothetical protein [Xanthobacter autotrophicus]|uniref:hypothetical protein n=1 Tax=Xanthobacter autotrophicus TaxID=280 RepID=UPI0024A6612B|nr:hypothetical protein [Xanthobacter autotrophicus]MDI4655135.1 hypothetical protein [Xanthobacter autotrophicus]